MKAQISTIEMITAVIILLVAFSTLFPGFTFKSRWDEAFLLVKGRDILLTIDRTNNLTEYFFNTTSLQNFIYRAFPANDTIIWTSIDDALKSKLVIACNCTKEQIANLTYWLKDLKLNNRSITPYICYTNLDEINPCLPWLNYPDVLVIWGYKDIAPYQTRLKDFLKDGNGIVGIMDFPVAPGATYKEIFGIDSAGDWAAVDYDVIAKPLNASSLTYQPYKLFYYLPFPSKAVNTTAFPPCTRNSTGNFTFNSTIYPFWICDGNRVYFDTDGNGITDKVVRERETFNISSYKFFLNYIDENKIDISFKPIYNFSDFCRSPGNKRIVPLNNELHRAFVYGIKRIGVSEDIRCFGVILNKSIGKTAWVADFSRNGLNRVEDDHKQLLNSLLSFVSNKKAKELTFGTVKVGYATSYVDVMNYDMFEIYKLNLGVGYPF